MRVYEGTIIRCAESGEAKAGSSSAGVARASVARYLVENKGRIVFVGDALPEEYRSAPRLELGERALLPAFADAHLHFSSFALFASTLAIDLREAGSIPEVLDLLGACERGKKPLLGFGLSAHSVAEGRLLEKADLDAAFNDVRLDDARSDADYANSGPVRSLAFFAKGD